MPKIVHVQLEFCPVWRSFPRSSEGRRKTIEVATYGTYRVQGATRGFVLAETQQVHLPIPRPIRCEQLIREPDLILYLLRL